YSRPFVGACELDISGEIDRNFEKYYTISEQLPTYISTVVKRDEQGKCVFAGGIVLQPLPFASEETLAEMLIGDDLDAICETLPTLGIDGIAEKYFQAKPADATYKYAIYQCHCSRAYLAEVIASLGETQTRQIIQEDGAVRIHCHYCNTEYEFTEADADKIFKSLKE
ncbi:MAG: Hsp33 family molecular chaperone HslO, partial [Clostridia bacterium]|nr:Hsp33 family molecular chaperone HslO [Clostridia bacterium]